MKTSIFLLVTSVFMATSGYAQEPITIDRALEMAEENNNAITVAANSLNSAILEENNSWNLFLPSLSLSSTTALTSENWNQILTGTVSIGLNASLPGLLTSNELGVKSKQISYEMTRDMVDSQVQNLFYYLLASEKSIEIQKEALELAQKQYRQMEVNYNNGFASEIQLLQSRLAMENVKPQISSATLNYEENLMNLKDLIGYEGEEEIILSGDLEYIAVKLDSETLIDNHIHNRQDIKMSKNMMDIQENLLTLTKNSELYPTLALQTSYSQSYYDLTQNNPMLSHEWSDNVEIALNLTWSPEILIKGSSTWVKMKNQETEVTNANLNFSDSIESARREIKKAVLQLDTYAKNIEVAELNLELSKKSYEMTNDSFKKGAAEILTVEDARQSLAEAQQSHLNTLFQYKIGLISLASALGTDLETVINQYGVN